MVQERGVPLAKEFDKIIQRSSCEPRLAKKPRLDSILRSDLEDALRKTFLASDQFIEVMNHESSFEADVSLH